MSQSDLFPFLKFSQFDFATNAQPSFLRTIKSIRDQLHRLHDADEAFFTRLISKFERLQKTLPRETIESHIHVLFCSIALKSDEMVEALALLNAKQQERHPVKANELTLAS